MFITNEAWKSTYPQFFVDPDESFWRVTKLALNVPWFLVSICRPEPFDDDEPIEIRETMMLADVRDVAGLIDACAKGELKFVAAYVVTPAHVNGSSEWKMDQLRAVWVAGEPMAPQQNVVIYETLGGACYGRSSLETPLEALANRTLSFRIPDQLSEHDNPAACPSERPAFV